MKSFLFLLFLSIFMYVLYNSLFNFSWLQWTCINVLVIHVWVFSNPVKLTSNINTLKFISFMRHFFFIHFNYIDFKLIYQLVVFYLTHLYFLATVVLYQVMPFFRRSALLVVLPIAEYQNFNPSVKGQLITRFILNIIQHQNFIQQGSLVSFHLLQVIYSLWQIYILLISQYKKYKCFSCIK